MGYIRTEEEVDKMISEMVRKTKGKYITQGVSFNKDSARQMELLKMVLLRSNSFSGFIKEMLAQEEGQDEVRIPLKSLMNGISGMHVRELPTLTTEPEKHEEIDVGNFL